MEAESPVDLWPSVRGKNPPSGGFLVPASFNGINVLGVDQDILINPDFKNRGSNSKGVKG